MKIFRNVSQWIMAALLLSAISAFTQTPQPQIFFSDLESGPNTGGQNGNGAFVTIWGKGFGATQNTSTITVGGGTVAAYPIWSDGKITFQLGAGAATGGSRRAATRRVSKCLP